MRKRGISPLIATVILVGSIIVIASLVYRFSLGTTVSTTEETSELIDTAMPVRFSTRWQPGGSCGSCTPPEDDCYSLFIENEENRDVGFIVRTTGNVGTAVSSDKDRVLGPFEAQIFTICLDVGQVGVTPYTAEIIPVTYSS